MSCATERKLDGECCHETGTWVADEVRLAVQKGYEVIDVFEAYEYDVTSTIRRQVRVVSLPNI